MHKTDVFFKHLDRTLQQREEMCNMNNTPPMAATTNEEPNTRPNMTSERQERYGYKQQYGKPFQLTQQMSTSLQAMWMTPEMEHVVDPLAMLRRCINYFATHPEIYGNNLHTLMEREIMHVMRLNASEQAMLAQYKIHNNPRTKESNKPNTLAITNTSSTLTLPPIPLSDKPISSTQKRKNMMSATLPESTFGFGELHLSHTAAGLKGYVRHSNNKNNYNENNNSNKYDDDLYINHVERRELQADVLPETIGWHGQLASPSPTHANRQRQVDAVHVTDFNSNETDGDNTHVNYNRPNEEARMDSSLANDGQLVSLPDTNNSLLKPAIVIDGTSYETTFLRQQMDQLQAAYNATCIRLHELNEENTRLKTQLQTTQDQTSRLSHDYTAAVEKIELARKEMELWKDRAHEASLPQSITSSYSTRKLANSTPSINSNNNNSMQVRRVNELDGYEMDADENSGEDSDANHRHQGRRVEFQNYNEVNQRNNAITRRLLQRQLVEAKRENDKMGKLWRETERALQEARRSFEGAEAEASQSHDHLSDAFHYIERLERHVARRDAYIMLQSRRQHSLEEKYEKLMWCVEELGTMTGVYSYVDYLLSSDKVWSLQLLLHMQKRSFDFHYTQPTQLVVEQNAQTSTNEVIKENEVNTEAVCDKIGPVLHFAPSPGTGTFVGEYYNLDAVYRVMCYEVGFYVSLQSESNNYNNYNNNNNTTTSQVKENAPTEAKTLASGVSGSTSVMLHSTRLRTTLYGAVACRVLRWANAFAIDYRGDQQHSVNNNVSGGENDHEPHLSLHTYRTHLPLLTLASVLLPLRAFDGTAAVVAAVAAGTSLVPTNTINDTTNNIQDNVNSGNNEDGGNKKESCVQGNDELQIRNSCMYDRATIRYILRNFWQVRVQQYTRQLEQSIHFRTTSKQRQHREDGTETNNSTYTSNTQVDANENNTNTMSKNSHMTKGKVKVGGDGSKSNGKQTTKTNHNEYNSDDDEEEIETETENVCGTFLDALVTFAIEFTSNDMTDNITRTHYSAINKEEGEDGEMSSYTDNQYKCKSYTHLYAVRGVIAKNNARFCDHGRLFFASIVNPHCNSSSMTTESNNVDAAGAGYTNTNSINTTNKSESKISDVKEYVEELPTKARELLCAMYTFALQYRSVDADLRLFYLIAHQYIPEMVAINFYVNLATIEQSCYKVWMSYLEKNNHTSQNVEASHPFGMQQGNEILSTTKSKATASLVLAPLLNVSIYKNKKTVERCDNPLDALSAAIDIIDHAPLVAENEVVEPDSDEDGYGSILPARHSNAIGFDDDDDDDDQHHRTLSMSSSSLEEEQEELQSSSYSLTSLQSPRALSRSTSIKNTSIAVDNIVKSSYDKNKGISDNNAATLAKEVKPDVSTSLPSPTSSRTKNQNEKKEKEEQQQHSSIDQHNGKETTKRNKKTKNRKVNMKGEKGETNNDNNTIITEEKSNGTQSGRSKRGAARQLIHNIRDYLNRVRSQRNLSPIKAQNFSNNSSASNRRNTQKMSLVPQEWLQMDDHVQRVLGAHTTLVNRYRESVESIKRTFTHQPSRRDRMEFNTERRDGLAATRGLLPLQDILAVLEQHCFASYAICSVSPTSPSYSSSSSLLASSSKEKAKQGFVSPLPSSGPTTSFEEEEEELQDKKEENMLKEANMELIDIMLHTCDSNKALHAMTRIGQMRPSSLHLQRLRFALALDQPSSLIAFNKLFAMDPLTLCPSHLYTELLSLTIDLTLQQQSLLMLTVLHCCAARHERYAAEGGEECDGNVPISFLKKGLTSTFAGLHLDRIHARAFAKHLVICHEMLEKDFDCRTRQFCSVPFYFVDPDHVYRSSEQSLTLHHEYDELQPMNDGMQTFQHSLLMLPVGSNYNGNNEDDNDGANKTVHSNESSDEEEWDLQDEARTCSLINLAFAIRTTYYIWDSSLTESAHLMLMASSVPPYTITDTHVQNKLMQAEIGEPGIASMYGIKPLSPTQCNRFEAPLQLPEYRELVDTGRATFEIQTVKELEELVQLYNTQSTNAESTEKEQEATELNVQDHIAVSDIISSINKTPNNTQLEQLHAQQQTSNNTQLTNTLAILRNYIYANGNSTNIHESHVHMSNSTMHQQQQQQERISIHHTHDTSLYTLARVLGLSLSPFTSEWCGNKDNGKSGNSKRKKGNKGNKVSKKKGENVSITDGGNKKSGNVAKRVGGSKKNAANDISELKSALDEMSSANALALQHDINVLRHGMLHRLMHNNAQPMTNHLTRLIHQTRYSGITANATSVDGAAGGSGSGGDDDEKQITLSHTCAAVLSLM